jgi:hypothetical protein
LSSRGKGGGPLSSGVPALMLLLAAKWGLQPIKVRLGRQVRKSQGRQGLCGRVGQVLCLSWKVVGARSPRDWGWGATGEDRG